MTVNLCARLHADIEMTSIGAATPGADAASLIHDCYNRLASQSSPDVRIHPALFRNLMNVVHTHADALSTPVGTAIRRSLLQLLKDFDRLVPPAAIDAALGVARVLRRLEREQKIADDSLEVFRYFAPSLSIGDVRARLTKCAARPSDDIVARAAEEFDGLRSHAPIVRDFYERLVNLLYVPLVLDGDHVEGAVAFPVQVTANFHQRGKPKIVGPPEVDDKFSEAVERAATKAALWLSRRGLGPLTRPYSVTLTMPETSLKVSGGSIELPLSLALIRLGLDRHSTLTLDPQVALSGPTDEAAVALKETAVKRVQGCERLIARRHVNNVNDVNAVCDDYFATAEREELDRKVPRVLSSTGDWNLPLLSQSAPVIPTVASTGPRLEAALEKHRLVQLRGISGIGKSWIIAQWLTGQHARSCDLVVHINVPERSSDSLLRRIWQQLQGTWGFAYIGPFEHEVRFRSIVLANHFAAAGMKRVLWVIDNAQSLADDRGRISDEEFNALFTGVGRGEIEHSVVLATTERLDLAVESGEVLVNDGFTPDQAGEYVDHCFANAPLEAATRSRLLKALGNFPRALALVVGHARAYGQLPSGIIEAILEKLGASAEGEVLARDMICPIILEHVLQELSAAPASGGLPPAEVLRAASTWFETFHLDGMRELMAPDGSKLSQPLTELERRSLIHGAKGRGWAMHDIVRKYIQDCFLEENKTEHDRLHEVAGDFFRDLAKKISPRNAVRDEYLFQAARHYETASDERLASVFDEVLRDRERMASLATNPRFAVQILRRATRVLAGKGADVGSFAAAQNVPWSLSRTFANAMSYVTDASPEEISEAINHCRAAAAQLGIEEGCELSNDAAQITGLRIVLGLQNGESVESLMPSMDAFRVWLVDRTSRPARPIPHISLAGRAYSMVAQQLEDAGRIDEAIEYLREAADAGARWDKVYLQLAKLQTDDEQRLACLQRGLDVFSDRKMSTIYGELAILRARQGTLQDIPKEVRQQHSSSSMVQISERLKAEGRTEDSITVLRDAVDDPTGIVQTHLAGRLIASRVPGSYIEALRLLRKTIKAQPTSSSPYIFLAKHYRSSRQLEKADAIVLEGLKRFASDHSLVIERIQVLKDRAATGLMSREELLAELHAMQSTPDGKRQLPVLIAIAELFDDYDDFDSAERCLLDATKLAGGDAAAHAVLSKFYLSHGRTEDAQRIVAAGLSRFPADESLCHEQVMMVRQRFTAGEMTRDAVEEALKAIAAATVVGRQASVLTAIGWTHFQIGNLDLAERYLMEAEEQAPTYAGRMRAAFYFHSGRLADAIDLLRGLYERRNDDTTTLGQLAGLMCRAGKAEEAVQLLEADQLRQSTFARILLRCYEEVAATRDLDPVKLVRLGKILRTDGSDIVHLRVARLLRQAGRNPEADRIYAYAPVQSESAKLTLRRTQTALTEEKRAADAFRQALEVCQADETTDSDHYALTRLRIDLCHAWMRVARPTGPEVMVPLEWAKRASADERLIELRPEIQHLCAELARAEIRMIEPPISFENAFIGESGAQFPEADVAAEGTLINASPRAASATA